MSSDALAIRGSLAWLNGVALARASEQRCFLLVRGFDAYVVMASSSQACALTDAELVDLTQDPVLRDSSFDL